MDDFRMLRMSRFSDTLMEHFQAPISRGVMESPSLVGTGSLDGYPPFVTFYLRIDSGHITDATFQAEGCGVTIACGSMLTELVHGRSLAECRQLTAPAPLKEVRQISSGEVR
jgi:NifU-like protein involved in Fe-S cluster formation